MTDTEYNELRAKIRRELAQEYNWDKQQANWLRQSEHWESIQEQQLMQGKHWQSIQDHYALQDKHWKWLTVIGAIALTVNGLAAFFAK